LSLETLENRFLLAGGPYIHIHDNGQLAVVDAATGEVQRIADLGQNIADIAFNGQGRLFGISADRLFEIDPVTGGTDELGTHGIDGANSLVFDTAGRKLYAMGRSLPFLYVIDDVTRPSQKTEVRLPGLDATVGANGDISFIGADLIVASADGRLLRYGFQLGPTRPGIIADRPLSRTDVFGLAVTTNQKLFGLTDDSILTLDIAAGNVVQREIRLNGATMDVVRGAAFFAEARGPVPVGTLSGIKWNDQNGDGVRHVSEPLLPDWEFYVDRNVNGVRDSTEPHSRTDDQGRYYLFGNRPGLHTVEEINANPTAWEQTAPLSSHRNLVGIYDFRNRTANNQLFHSFGLPALSPVSVSVGVDMATFASAAGYLELGTALGNSPFTIAIDATYTPVTGAEQFLVSQRRTDTGTDQDFTLSVPSGSPAVSATFCNAAGTCAGPLGGTIDRQRRAYALTWDGDDVGLFFGTTLQQRLVTGSLPDIDGSNVRFGNPSTRLASAPAGLTGTIHEIRVFNKSLTENELRDAFSDVTRPAGYSVLLAEGSFLDQLNFGNRIRVAMVPEIEVRRDRVDGPVLTSGSVLDLGTAPANDTPPKKDLWIKNTGTAALQITSVTATTGFVITGNTSATLGPDQTLMISVAVSDLTVGTKTGELRIANNDSDENPFVITLRAEITPAAEFILVNDASGAIWRFNPQTGSAQSVASGLRQFTDIAWHPSQDLIYGIDATSLYQIDLPSRTVTRLFDHNVRNAAALTFTPTGDLFAGGDQIFRIDVAARTSILHASFIRDRSSDLTFAGNQLYVSAESGNLYRVTAPTTVVVGNLNRIAMQGLATIDSTTLAGFANTQAYRINVTNGTAIPTFPLSSGAILGAASRGRSVGDVHNDANPYDVNGDGAVIPIDVLLVINELNSPSYTDPISGRIVGPPPANAPFPDVNDDGFLSPLDALLIINRLNNPVPSVAMDVSPVTAIGDLRAPRERLAAVPWAHDLALTDLVDEDGRVRNRLK
jgi:sugar lactone lactonase YvrE